MSLSELCKTRYPIFVIHGAGFRDFKHIGYWGRIPKSLENNGATIYYGRQDSWGTIEENAKVLKENLLEIIRRDNVEKVNIIAHSKGGLEARYLVSALDCAPLVASITTISTPHNGSKTMDKLMKLPKPLIRFAGFFVNCWFRLLGDKNPDFYTSCYQFTSEHAARFNSEIEDVPEIHYQSVATVMRDPASDLLMWLPNLVVGLIEGENDGLVTPVSASRWDNPRVWKSGCRRGISHVDSVDMRRKPLTKKEVSEGVSDVADAYIQLVSELIEAGY